MLVLTIQIPEWMLLAAVGLAHPKHSRLVLVGNNISPVSLGATMLRRLEQQYNTAEPAFQQLHLHRLVVRPCYKIIIISGAYSYLALAAYLTTNHYDISEHSLQTTFTATPKTAQPPPANQRAPAVAWAFLDCIGCDLQVAHIQCRGCCVFTFFPQYGAC